VLCGVMSDSAEKIVRLQLPTFDGKDESFLVWWERFQAYAAVYNFDTALESGGDSDLPSSEKELSEDENQLKKLKEAMKKNKVALANLTMAFTTSGSMALIKESKTNEWPKGLAYKVIEKLQAKHQPKDTISRVELRSKLNGVKMKNKDDPQELFDRLTKIESEYNDNDNGKKVELEDLIAVVVSVAPEKYQSILALEQVIKGEQVTLDDLKKVMKTLYRQAQGKSISEDNNDDGEMVLAGFKGNCHICGERGHRKFKCPNKGNNNNKKKNKFKGKCNHCGKPGHREVDCWNKEENTHRRPKNWKPRGESGQTAINQNCSVETQLMAV